MLRILPICLFLVLGCRGQTNADSKRTTPTLSFDSEFAEGNQTISGTITFNKRIGIDTLVQIGYFKGTPIADFSENESASKPMPASYENLHYNFSKLGDGEYSLWVRVDDNDDESFGTGDLVGYYNKSGAAINDYVNASLVELSGDGAEEIDISLRSF